MKAKQPFIKTDCTWITGWAATSGWGCRPFEKQNVCHYFNIISIVVILCLCSDEVCWKQRGWKVEQEELWHKPERTTVSPQLEDIYAFSYSCEGIRCHASTSAHAHQTTSLRLPTCPAADCSFALNRSTKSNLAIRVCYQDNGIAPASSVLKPGRMETAVATARTYLYEKK